MDNDEQKNNSAKPKNDTKDSKKSRRTFAFLLVGVVLGLIIGYFTFRIGVTFSAQTQLWLLVTPVGAFGGLLYTLRDKGLVLPHRESDSNVINPGWLADCAYGIAGSYVVFLIVPGNFTLEGFDY